MEDRCSSLLGAFLIAERANRYLFQIRTVLDDEPFETITLEGSSLFLENGVRDYRASLVLRVVVESAAKASDLLRHPAEAFAGLMFKESSEDSKLVFSYDVAEVCRDKRCDIDSQLKLISKWIRAYLVEIGKLQQGEKPEYEVVISDKPSFDEEDGEWKEFAYVWGENNQVSSDCSFNEKVLEAAFGDFLDAVNEVLSGGSDADDEEVSAKLTDGVASAYEYFGDESGNCYRIDYWFSEGDLGDLVENYDECSGLPLFNWYSLALEENPFIFACERWSDDSISSSGLTIDYWTKQTEEAKKFMDDLFEEDAETFRTMAEHVRKSIADGKKPEWLSGNG